jgi:hypothetical protein
MDSFWAWQTALNFLAAVGAAFIGRLVRHLHLVQKGIRRFWGMQLLIELPVAIFMGFVGNGLADWLALSPKSTIGLVAALSYLGPAAIEQLTMKWLKIN